MGRDGGGKGMAMQGSDSDMGARRGLDSTVYQRYSFSSLPLSLALLLLSPSSGSLV
jgi:hypothetical protein